MSPGVRVRRVGAAEAASDAPALAGALADVLIDCVRGGASVSFMASFSHDQAVAFWRKVLDGVARGERALLVAEQADGRLVGTAQLVLDLPDNQPHRADVAKMLVHRDARRRGVAAQLLTAVDEVARAEARTVLVLDTVTGSAAARLYERHGWQRAGDIPRYALLPDGTPCGTTYYYRLL